MILVIFVTAMASITLAEALPHIWRWSRRQMGSHRDRRIDSALDVIVTMRQSSSLPDMPQAQILDVIERQLRK